MSLLIGLLVKGQTRLENVSFTKDANQIVVNYDLYGEGVYSAQLFYSKDNGLKWNGPVKSVSGDIEEISEGESKSIRWDVLKDFAWFLGENVKFKVVAISYKGEFKDNRDNKTYKWLRIGEQIWMAENLAFNPDANGYWINDKITNDGYKYGNLYIWDVAQKVCPEGWHLPSNEEWQQLEILLGMSKSDAEDFGERGTGIAKKLKSTGDWSENLKGDNSSGFNALPAGLRSNQNLNKSDIEDPYNCKSIYHIGSATGFWTCSPYKSNAAILRFLNFTNAFSGLKPFEIQKNAYPRDYGFSVRCVKDNN
jgi:uncharacterized protein (TIGR02145 family)